jgi:hypothetical protein
MTTTDTEQLLELLADTPHRLASLSRSLEDERLSFKPDETAWSANDILAHFCAPVRMCGAKAFWP